MHLLFLLDLKQSRVLIVYRISLYDLAAPESWGIFENILQQPDI